MKDIAPSSNAVLLDYFNAREHPRVPETSLNFFSPQGPHMLLLSAAASRIEAYRGDRDSWREGLWTGWRRRRGWCRHWWARAIGSGIARAPDWEIRGVVYSAAHRAP